ncbi:MAG: NAD(P)H-dependent oxidoreductase subunit E [Candidatus Cloacimonetes bacterium]|nr:NAD(P)H-dependent oxidoreductase subunit E [Candidatus Cloacimonadota bacterium]
MDTIKVTQIIDKWQSDPDYAVEMMQDIQQEFRHIPRSALEEITRRTKTPLARLYHIATFYKAFSLTPRGKYVIQVCTGSACHVKGAGTVLETLQKELKLEAGETTSDRLFTLEKVPCLGFCSMAPVIMIGSDLIGEVKATEIPALINKYREADHD